MYIYHNIMQCSRLQSLLKSTTFCIRPRHDIIHFVMIRKLRWFSQGCLGRLECVDADVLLHLREVTLIVVQTLQHPL